MKTFILTFALIALMGPDMPDKPLVKATFGSGCFWCTEAVFERIAGVQTVVSGYAGGTKRFPTYDEVCSGATGHAEVTQITFDPSRVSYEQLLEVFWKSHDPTTMNRQGADVGDQYRSVIFYHDEQQKKLAEESKRMANPKFNGKIVTQIVPLTEFYKAEEYHQDYFKKNPNAPYCVFVIKPKLDKLQLKQ